MTETPLSVDASALSESCVTTLNDGALADAGVLYGPHRVKYLE